MAGRDLGRYQILEQIGAGGMAAIYKAYQPAMNRYVAIKTLSRHIAGDETFRVRFEREAHAIARLEHPHILPVYDIGEVGETPYLVMRYTESGTLENLIAGRSLTVERAVQLAAQIAEALAYAHMRGVVHRDVKPANVLIGSDGGALLMDFGIAKIVTDTLNLTSDGTLVGTPAYMAPEQLRGQGVDARSDIYALGVVLYQALTGECPFVSDTPVAVALMHMHNLPRPPRQLNPAIPEAIEQIVLHAIEKNPDDRFQTAGEMAEALRDALADLRPQIPSAGVGAPARSTATSARAVPAGGAARHAWPIVLGSLVIVVLAALAAFLAFRSGNQGRIASATDLGRPLSQPATVLARSGGASVFIGESVLWSFNLTLLNAAAADGATYRSATAALGERTFPYTMTFEVLDPQGAPAQFLPLTAEERAQNESGAGEHYELSVGSLADAGDGQALVFYSKALGPDPFNTKRIGTGVARVPAGAINAVRDPALLFTAPEPSFQTGAVVVDGLVYVYGCDKGDEPEFACRVARAPLDRAGQRAAYEFWDGERWVADLARAQPVMRGFMSGFSVSWNPYLQRYLAVFSPPFSNDISMMTAPRPEGPWSTPVLMFQGLPTGDPQAYNSDAREHPEFVSDRSRSVVVSYFHPLGELKGETRLVKVTFE